MGQHQLAWEYTCDTLQPIPTALNNGCPNWSANYYYYPCCSPQSWIFETDALRWSFCTEIVYVVFRIGTTTEYIIIYSTVRKHRIIVSLYDNQMSQLKNHRIDVINSKNMMMRIFVTNYQRYTWIIGKAAVTCFLLSGMGCLDFQHTPRFMNIQ